MRRLIVVLAIVFLAVIGWFVLFRQDGDNSGGAAGKGDEAAHATEAEGLRARPKAPRQRTAEEIHEEEVSAFLSQWPEVGQDRGQDPALGAITGRVYAAREVPVGEGVVESSARGKVSARAKIGRDGRFAVKNVEPGKGIALTARAPDYAPGGLDKLVVAPGQSLDVGAIYVGTALDPSVTNHVEVKVVRAGGGEPVVGATVTATSTLYGALIALGAWEKQPGGTVVRVQTDDKGIAAFDKLPPSSYDVFAEAEGFAFEVDQRYLVQGDTKATITLELDPAQTIEGKVLDDKGEPVGKAHVAALRWGSFTMNPATSTDDDGKFVLTGIASGSYMIFAVKPEIGSKDVNNVAAGTKDLAVVLQGGADLALKVIDAASGAPVPEFTVRPYRSGPLGYLYSPQVDVKAEDGVWRQKMSQQVSWGVDIGAKGYAKRSLPTVKLPTTEPVEVKLEPSGVVHGLVKARNGGKSVIGAKIFVKHGGTPPSPDKDLQTVTDGKGEFVLDGMPRTPFTIWISHVDFTDASFPVEPQPRGADGAPPAAQEFQLGSGGRIEGHAFAPGRVPRAGEDIQLAKGFMDPLSLRNTVVAADGSFSFKNVPPDTYRVSVGRGFGGDAKNNVVVPDGGVVVVDFGADTGGQKMTGRIVKDDQSPVANVGVQLEGPTGSNQQTTTDAQGRFAFENLAAGKYAVRSWGRTKVVDVLVKADEAPAEVVLTVLSASIEGKVVDGTTGTPLSGAWIDCELTADAQGKAPAQPLRAGRGGRQTGADGGFRIGNLEEGRYRIRAYRDPYGTEMADAIDVAAGETKSGIEIRLGAAGTLSGFAKNAAGQPIEGAAVHVRNAQGVAVLFVSLVNTSGDGSYTQGQLKPGEYEVRLEKDGYAPAKQQVTIEPGKQARADFTLLQGGRIEVTARLPDGTAVAGAAVTLLDASGARVEKGLSLGNIFSSAAQRTDAEGRITIRGVAAGRYTVRVVRDADNAESTANVDVVEATTSSADVTFAGN